MSLIIDLPADLEAELTAESERRGVPLGEVVVGRIRRDVSESSTIQKPKNGRECLAQWREQGLLGLWNDIENSSEYVHEMRKQNSLRRHTDDHESP